MWKDYQSIYAKAGVKKKRRAALSVIGLILIPSRSPRSDLSYVGFDSAVNENQFLGLYTELGHLAKFS